MKFIIEARVKALEIKILGLKIENLDNKYQNK